MPDLRSARILDLGEKYALVVVFGYFCAVMLTSYASGGSPLQPLYVFDQLLVLVFILVRRPTDQISQRPGEWFAGIGGTFLPLLMVPLSVENGVISTVAAGAIMVVGTLIHLAAKLTLRRSFGVIAANRGVKASGPYRFVRHPMYAGYVITQIGFILAGPNVHNVIVLALTWLLYIWRINAEERVLSQDPKYAALSDRTRYRLLPGVY